MIVDVKSAGNGNNNGDPAWLNESIPRTSDNVLIDSHNECPTETGIEQYQSPDMSWAEEKSSTDKVMKDLSLSKKKKSSIDNLPEPQRHTSINVLPEAPIEDEIFSFCGCYLDPVLIGFQVFHILGGLSSIASVSANFYVFCDMRPEDGLREVILRLFAVLFGVINVLVETEFDVFMKHFMAFHSWFLRGLWYAFIGVLTGLMHPQIVSFMIPF